MTQLKMERTFVLTLTKREFLIVGKALRGTLKPDELQEALALQESLARAKHMVLEQELHESQKLINNIGEGG